MKPVSLVTAGALALATAVLTIAPVVPAFAAELPETDSIYSITDLEAPAQLLGIDPISAEGNAIGSGADALPYEEDIVYYESQGGAYDPVSGDAYFIQFVVYDDDGDVLEWWLGTTDLTTGETDTVGRFYLPEFDDRPVITAIAIQPDGDAYALGGPDEGDCGCDIEEFYLFELDLNDASLELVSETSQAPEGEWFTAFAANPMTGELVAVGIDSGTIYTIDPDNGEFSDGETPDWEDAVEGWNTVVALAFDSTGNPWLVIYDDYGFAVLVKNGGDGPEDVNSISLDSEDIGTTSLIIKWPGEDEPEAPAKPTAANGKLFALSWDDQYNQFQLFSVDPTTGLSTPVGNGNGVALGSNSAGYQPAYDATTHTVYYIADLDTDSSDDALALARINTTTGVTTIGEEFWIDSESLTLGELTAMAIGPDGAAYVIGEVDEDGTRNVLFSLNLTTAKLTIVDDIELDEDSHGSLPITAFAADPTTGKYYAMSQDDADLFEVDVETADFDLFGEVEIPSYQGGSYVLSLQIDSAGRFWVIYDSFLDPDGQAGPINGGWWVYLSSFTLTDLDAVEAGLLWDDPYYASGLIFLPTLAAGPSLAATGVEPGAIGVGGAAVLLLLLGGAGVIAARRRSATR